MIKKRFTFGDKGIDEMLLYLNKLRRSINAFPDEVVTNCATKAENSIEQKLNSMDLDGNAMGTVITVSNSTPGHSKATVSHIGQDVAFLEFGTGMVGSTSPHPLSPENNWEYYIDTIFKKTIRGMPGWFYKGKFRVGIPAGRAVFNAGQEIKSNLRKIEKEAMRDALNIR